MLFSLLAVGAGKEPYYIVDGKLGVSADQLPPAEEIASKTKIDPEEAAYIYGDRAANGVIIIRTKEYERKMQLQVEHNRREYEQRQAAEERERIEQETLAKQQAVQQQENQKMRLIIMCVGPAVMAFLIILLFKHSKTSFEEACRIAQVESPKHTVKSERFNANDSTRFVVMIFLWPCMALFGAFVLWLCYTSVRGSMIEFIILIAVEALAIYVLIDFFMHTSKCYVEIDDEGIRGVYPENSILPIYEGFNIRWEQVASGKVIRESWGRISMDRLVFYSDEDCQNREGSIFMPYFSTSEITAQVNRFYARYSGKRLMKYR